MALLDRLRRFAPGVLLALGLAASGCSGSSDEESAASDDAITNIDNTKVKHQVIGNCWLYATVGWVEALHLKATAEKLDLSESYLTYWRWFDVLGTSPDVASAAAAVNEGGTWELASELIRRYGLMAETDFAPEPGFSLFTGGGDMAALNAVNAALANPASALRQAMERRERPALVHALAKLWKLPSSLVADLDATFGASAGKTFDKGAVPSATSKVLARSRIQVSSTTTKSAEPRPMPLSDVLHGGSEGWHHLGAPPNANVDRAARRAFERCLQRTLHAGLPIPLSWKVQWHALSPTGRFEAARIRGSEAGGHLSLLYDYEARDVPGSGTLPAGAPETRPRALEAALDDRTTTSFFRIKNSWGLVPTDPVQAVGRLLPNTPEYGDDDIEPEYGYHWAAEWTFYVVLPPGF